MLDGQPEGTLGAGQRTVIGTNLHGVFESDEFRYAFLTKIADTRGFRFPPSTASFGAARTAQLDRLGDLVEQHLDLGAVDRLIDG